MTGSDPRAISPEKACDECVESLCRAVFLNGVIVTITDPWAAPVVETVEAPEEPRPDHVVE